MAIEYLSPSPLSHFDPADLLDVLSTGVIVLDSQLCVVYANVGAQDLLAVGLNRRAVARSRSCSTLRTRSICCCDARRSSAGSPAPDVRCRSRRAPSRATASRSSST